MIDVAKVNYLFKKSNFVFPLVFPCFYWLRSICSFLNFSNSCFAWFHFVFFFNCLGLILNSYSLYLILGTLVVPVVLCVGSVCTCKCVCVCACIWRAEVNLGYLYLVLYHLTFWDKLSVNLYALIRWGWLAGDPQGSDCLRTTWLVLGLWSTVLLGFWGHALRSSCLTLYQWNNFSSPIYGFKLILI